MKFYVVLVVIVSIVLAIGAIAPIVWYIWVFSPSKKIKKAPILTVPDVIVVAKRVNPSGGVYGGQNIGMTGTGIHGHIAAECFVTFEFPNGDRLEFRVDQGEFGLMVERDVGELTFRHTQFIGFDRYRR